MRVRSDVKMSALSPPVSFLMATLYNQYYRLVYIVNAQAGNLHNEVRALAGTYFSNSLHL